MADEKRKILEAFGEVDERGGRDMVGQASQALGGFGKEARKRGKTLKERVGPGVKERASDVFASVEEEDDEEENVKSVSDVLGF